MQEEAPETAAGETIADDLSKRRLRSPPEPCDRTKEGGVVRSVSWEDVHEDNTVLERKLASLQNENSNLKEVFHGLQKRLGCAAAAASWKTHVDVWRTS